MAARGFDAAADVYERARPGYPPAAVAWLAANLGLGGAARVVEVGAGTGKLTRHVVGLGPVTAVEPLAAMRAKLVEALPGTAVLGAAAEALPFRSGSLDAVIVAQAFHWFDPRRAPAEVHRVLRPGGRLGLIWNAWDDSIGWVAAVHALMDPVAGDTPRYRTGRWREPFDAGQLFTPLAAASFEYAQQIDAATMLGRVASTSFVAVLPEAERRRLLDRAAAVLDGLPPTFSLPHRTDAYWCEAR